MRRLRIVIALSVSFISFHCIDNSAAVEGTAMLRCPDNPVIRSGEATFYTFADGRGNCSFDSVPGVKMVGAVSNVDYAGSLLCG